LFHNKSLDILNKNKYSNYIEMKKNTFAVCP
jgi:hypothetical protein